MIHRSTRTNGRLPRGASLFGRDAVAAALAACALAIAAGPSPACAGDASIAQDDAFVYQKRDTREATRRATLAQYIADIEWGPWFIAGPFDNTGRASHDIVFGPERSLLTSGSLDMAAVWTGRDDREARWRPLDLPRNAGEWPRIDLKVFDEGMNDDSIAYIARTFEASADGTLRVECGSDDGLKLWVNGRLLVDADAYRGLSLGDHLIDVPFRSGTNTLLAKVSQGAGGWEFQMRPRVDDRLMARLEHRLDLDFPDSPEAISYRRLGLLEPESVVLEVGGLDVLPDGRPIISTRRGEVWIVGGATGDPPIDLEWTLFAAGLHEPLGMLAEEDGGVLVVQRGELTRLRDVDGDDRADVYETVADGWGVSGNYHEFAFGPEHDGEGRLWLTLNVGFCGALGKSIVPWRGWALIADPETGVITPVCGGLRSPNGLGRNVAGEMFYTDNQGDWVGTNKLSHLDVGDWHGHPSSFRWYADAGMTTPDPAVDFKPPAIWFPYGRMGQSASDIALDETGGRFGPFTGQLFVGDQTTAEVMRVFLEEVDGVWQGACFPFRSGFDCGVNRLAFMPDGSLLVGMTNRGWGSRGTRGWGLQRLVYSGVVPFEMLAVRARPDGFEIEFTKPIDRALASEAANWRLDSFTYERWEKYGSPEIDRATVTVREARVSDDGRSVHLVCDGLRPGYVHGIDASAIRGTDGEELLHESCWYTLNRIGRAD